MKVSSLTADAVDRVGYAIVPDVIQPEECVKVLADLAALRPLRSRAGLRHAMRYPTVRAIAEDPRVLAVAREVLGEPALPFRATLFDKPQNSNWLVAWHQDTALPMRAKRDSENWGPWSLKDGILYAHAPAEILGQILALRIHLDDSTAHNGPLRVLPQTHSQGVLTDGEIHQMASEIVAEQCLAPRGGITAMRPLIIHASSKSRSDQSRRVLHVEYAPSQDFVDAIGLAIA
jgi:ectoine hydroxylase-related dioxygenase (phytanoyl-CoA dioxygenase family)